MVNRLEKLAAWAVLGLLLIGADLIGNLSAYGYSIILLASLPLMLTSRDRRSRMMRLESVSYLLAFLLLLAAFVLSAQAASDVRYAGNFLFFLMFMPAVSLLGANAGPRSSLIFASLALLGVACALVWAIYEVNILGEARVVGFVNLTNPYAMAAVMLGFLATMGFFAGRGTSRFMFLLGPVLATGTALLAGTRSAVVMLAGLGVLFLAFWIWTLKGRSRFLAAGVVLVGLILAIAVSVVFADDLRALSAFNTIAVFFGQGEAIDYSTEIRLNLYYGGLQAFLESPIFGHGWWHHVEAARPYMSPQVQADTVRWSHLHNDYVNFAALAGVMGLLAYLLYMVTPIISATRSPRDSQYLPRLYGAAVLALCYAIFGMFDTSFSMEVLLGFGPVCAAALLGFCVDGPSRRRPKANLT